MQTVRRWDPPRNRNAYSYPLGQKDMHSPGPWRVGDAGATVFGPPNGNPSPETVANVKRRANAALIAAAPDLAAALRALLDWDGSGDPAAPYDAARAALAKAGL